MPADDGIRSDDIHAGDDRAGNDRVGDDRVGDDRAGDDILAELAALRARLPDATGTLVATIDGMLVAHEAAGPEPEVLAAMSAAQLGLGRQFGVITRQGTFLESVTRSTHGCVAVFAAGTTGLLTVLAGPDLNVGRLYHEARPVAARLGALLGTAPPAPLRHG